MFSLNGRRQSLNDIPPSTVLYDYLRTHTSLTGTKSACGEGGCGSCSVQVHELQQETGQITTRCINACLCPVGTLEGASVVTVEGLGTAKTGFNAVQERIAGFHGSQCGFCTPGMVVACHSALTKAHSKGYSPSPMDMEKSVDGNLCRCTGYRPILDACKSLTDTVDLEDLGMHSLDNVMRQHKDISIDQEVNFPSWLMDYNKKKGAGSDLIKARAVRPQGVPQTWIAPASIPDLLGALRTARRQQQSVRLVGGNTGPGVYKDWPVDIDVLVSTTRIAALTSITCQLGSLNIGAAVTQTALVDHLLEASQEQQKSNGGNIIEHGLTSLAQTLANGKGGAGLSGPQGGPQGGSQGVFTALAHHLQRIAGNQVRSAATMGGNLALAKQQGLESDAATLLAALGARIAVVSVDAEEPRWFIVNEFLEDASLPEGCLGTTHLLTSICIPPIRATQYFWSYKVAQRHFNAHAFLNAAMLLNIQAVGANGHTDLEITDAQVVFGFAKEEAGKPKPTWQVQQAKHVIQQLKGKPGTIRTIGHALAAVAKDVQPGDISNAGDAAYVRAAAEGVLFEGLASLLRQGMGSNPLMPRFVVELGSLHDVPPSRGQQFIPDFERPEGALGAAFMKERALLQASGEALYTIDQPRSRDGLWAQYVASQHPLACFDSVDASEALAVPGVVDYISASDIPKAGQNSAMGQEQVFAVDRVEWVGQPIGLIVAETRAAAERGAQLVKVHYTFPPDLGHPIMQIEEARKAGSYHKTDPSIDSNSSLKEGQSMEQALQDCQHQVRGGRWRIPSQLHFYMEMQSCVAQGDGEGGMEVWSSTQSPEFTMKAVALVLGLPQSRCTVRCRRMGGAFGGKTARSAVPAAAVAVAAHKLGRQVRMSVSRAQDCKMNGGRARIDLEYDIGFDSSGRIHALDLRVYMLGGIIMGGSTVDVFSLAGMIDQAYAIPAFRFKIKLCKTNRPPHSAVRAPGKFESPIIMEHIIEHVAARLDMDPNAVRELNFLKAPSPGGEEGVVKMALGSTIPASLYTLPRLWQQLKEDTQFSQRQAQVAAFNKRSTWLKRGISITPARFKALLHGATGPRPALVSLYPDGTVLLTVAGTEMGQGLFTKAKQTALNVLSKALPERLRPLPAHLVEVADNNTSALPNTGMDAGSTTAEGACESVRQACEQLLEKTLLPQVEAMKGSQGSPEGQSAEALWKEVMKAASNPMSFPNKQLSAYALFDGSRRDKPGKEKLIYSAFGASCSEVEVNMLTGERRVLRTDIMLDAGNSLSPAIDAGQAEGGFVYALGMLLQEDVTYDAQGQPQFDSTWNYKIPSAACIPRQLNVHMLKDSPNKVGIMTSKSTGEPPLLASVSVLTAFAAAVAAAKKGLAEMQAQAQAQAKTSSSTADEAGSQASVQEQVLCDLEAPVTVKEIKRVLGRLQLSELLLAQEE